jgi:D-glycero-D-manno-heptose 1,7-bisphosphate phosphatase
MNRAIFLDRDGTLVHPRHYPTRPADLQLYVGIGPELRLLQTAGFKLIMITNQSGLARGYFGEADLDRMHEYLASELAKLDVRLDAIYYCPHHPEGTVRELAIECECRKPRPGMLLRAAAEHALDLGRSWFVGDILDDIEAGRRAGCRTVLVDLGTESPPEGPLRQPDFIAEETPHALRIIAAVEQIGQATNTSYLPVSWRESAGNIGTVKILGETRASL